MLNLYYYGNQNAFVLLACLNGTHTLKSGVESATVATIVTIY